MKKSQKTPTGITKSSKNWKIARNVFVGLASISAAFTGAIFLTGNAAFISERNARAAQFDEVMAQVEPRESFAARTLEQAEQDYSEGRISLADYFKIQGSMQHVRSDMLESTYVLTYASPELKAQYQALTDECYKPTTPYYNAAKYGLVATGALLGGLTFAAVGTKMATKKEKEAENQERFL